MPSTSRSRPSFGGKAFEMDRDKKVKRRASEMDNRESHGTGHKSFGGAFLCERLPKADRP